MTTREVELAYWINTRYSIKEKKNAGLLPPWTADPHMANVRYCNVHREDDKVTEWLARRWRPNHHEVWEIVLARMINYIPSLYAIVGDVDWHWDLPTISAILKERRARGEKVFTSAYTISTCGQRMDKLDYVMNIVKQCMSGYLVGPTLRDTHTRLMQINGLGSFLAAQVVADLKNTAGHPLGTAPDYWTWSAHGPGSLRGLGWFFNKKVTPSAYEAMIKKCYDLTIPLIDRQVPSLHMQDFQNCLCEFSKYMKVKHENGHVRNRYSPR